MPGLAEYAIFVTTLDTSMDQYKLQILRLLHRHDLPMPISHNSLANVQVIFHPYLEFLRTVVDTKVLEDLCIVLVYDASAISSLLYISAELQ